MEQVARKNIEIMNAELVARQAVVRVCKVLGKMLRLVCGILAGVGRLFFGRTEIDTRIDEMRNKYRGAGYHV